MRKIAFLVVIAATMIAAITATAVGEWVVTIIIAGVGLVACVVGSIVDLD